ncbi:6-methylsalicylic acid decarboxylase [Lachnellula subtilissima]|uniref:6-methylsalicylic acid decarboxylase n=1 Tax=Lachnellula subtilissima TaxID=602034 RepID=A0A8H8S278_9HELO|nr:6-methylsalicylic acid decarboxylase [Lachnellula subtilissima]
MKEESWAESGRGLKAPGKEGERIAGVEAGDRGQESVHRAHFLDVLVKRVPEGVARFGKRIERDTLARNAQLYLGHHGNVLTFPIEKGKTMNVVAFQNKDGDWKDERWVLPMKREDMINDFAGWGESVQRILSERSSTVNFQRLMENPDVWALFDHPPAPNYYKGRLAILGDAAHASTPHQGAGADQAIEDAYILTHLLGKVNSLEDIEDAFRAYDHVRRPRTQKVVAARLYEFEDETVGTDLYLLKKNLETRYNWIWNEDLLQQLETAQDMMGLESNL